VEVTSCHLNTKALPRVAGLLFLHLICVSSEIIVKHAMQTVTSLTKSATVAKEAAQILVFAALTALGAQIEIPLYPVPMTMQTAAVLAAGVFAGARAGAISQVLYLVSGFFLPVYAGGAMGVAHLFGATGGYLIAFPIAAWLAGTLTTHEKNPVRTFASVFATSLVIFALGATWLKVSQQLSWELALAHGVYPFLIGDVLKCALVSASAWGWTALNVHLRT
jgi:biotin transport system substrate-specific component